MRGCGVLSSLPGTQFFRNLIERRALLYQLVRRDFERRFVGSAGGWLWGVIHPLVLLLSWTFVFHFAMGSPVPKNAGTDSYTLFVFCGYLPWMLFQETVQRSSTSLIESSNLITKTVFPSELVPLSIFCSSLISHAISLVLAVIAVLVWGGGVGWALLWLPVFVFLLALLATGLSWIVAAFQVYLRDSAQAVMVLLTLWFWVTPIFIEVSQVPERLRWLPRLNPLTAFVQVYRGGLLSHTSPALGDLAYAAAFSVTVFVVGGLIFRQLKRGFADVL